MAAGGTGRLPSAERHTRVVRAGQGVRKIAPDFARVAGLPARVIGWTNKRITKR
jgi:hypothetical protein